ncbi:hypothetical protein IQ250_25985 [Pseudanabaenaceae cyanobacterium LEGE 13415]|nr:hypothetical protein [Pseudanabaenaceae cyanobacterium LEGE 13415]
MINFKENDLRMRQENEDFIKSVLGEQIQPMIFSLKDKTWQGWKYSTFQTTPASYVDALVAEEERPRIVALLRRYWRQFYDRNIRLWSHFGVDIFAVPDLPTLEIVAYEEVGKYKAKFHGVTSEIVYNTLIEIFNECPYEILFADAAGLEAYFIDPINRTQAERFQDLIETIASDSINLMTHELYKSESLDDSDPRHQSVAIDYLLQNQKLRLYWD